MSAMFIMVICSVTIAGGFLAAYLWSVKDGQYDDKEGASIRMLHDDDLPL